MTTFVLPTTPSSTPTSPVPSEYQFVKTSHALRTPHPHRSQRLVHHPVQPNDLFTRATPELVTSLYTATLMPVLSDDQVTISTSSTSISSEDPTPESSPIKDSSVLSKKSLMSPILTKTTFKKKVRNSSFLHKTKHYRSGSLESNRILTELSFKKRNSSFLHGEFPKPNVSFLHSSKWIPQKGKTPKPV